MRRSATLRRRAQAALFLAPAVLVFLLFKYGPILQAFGMSLYDWQILDPPGRWVGLGNFRKAFQSELFWLAWRNNLVLFGFGLLLGFWPPLIQAICLNEIRRGQTLFRVGYLLPMTVPSIAALLLWKWIYNQQYGLLNLLLGACGLPPQGWLVDPHLAKMSLMLPGLLGGGMGVFLYLAAIKAVPLELFEAAEIDGAGPWAKLCHVLVPRIRYMVLLQFILALATGFQIFDQIFVLTGGGPVNATRVISLLIYRSAFEHYEMGYAVAIAVCLFAVVFVVTAVQLAVSRMES